MDVSNSPVTTGSYIQQATTTEYNQEHVCHAGIEQVADSTSGG
jgi:hypothetical protein